MDPIFQIHNRILTWKPLASIRFQSFPCFFQLFFAEHASCTSCISCWALPTWGGVTADETWKKYWRHTSHQSWHFDISCTDQHGGFVDYPNPWGYQSFRGSLNLVLIGHAHLDWICTCVLIRCTYVYRKWDEYDDVLMNKYIYMYDIYIYIYYTLSIHTCIHTYIHTYVHTYINTYIHTDRHTYIHKYKNAHIYIHIYAYIHTLHYITYIHTYIYIYT